MPSYSEKKVALNKYNQGLSFRLLIIEGMHLAKFKSRLKIIIRFCNDYDGQTADVYGGREGPFQTSDFLISISELMISKDAFPKLSFLNLQLTTPTSLLASNCCI